jgi:basic membrane protein A
MGGFNMKKKFVKIVTLLVLSAFIISAVSLASAAAEKRSGSNYSVTFLCRSLGDMSFVDSAKRGIDQLASDYGFNAKAVEAGGDASKYESYVSDICKSGVNFVISTNDFQDYVEKVAADYPDTRFIIVDAGRDGKVANDNILYVSYAQNEGSYLVGMVAAAKSKSGVIGAVGGIQNSVICDFISGYVDGAKNVNPDIKVVISWVGNWDDSAKMLELCTQQHNTYGADVFFPMAGSASLGAFEAATKIKNTWTIGVDSDQYAIFSAQGNPYADYILTSMLKEVGNSFVSIFSDFLDGKEYWGTVRIFGLKEGGVGYVNNDMLKKNIPAETIAQVEAAKTGIIGGSLKAQSYFDFKNRAEYDDFIKTVSP